MKLISYSKIFLLLTILIILPSNYARSILGDDELAGHPPIPPGELIFPVPVAPAEDLLPPAEPERMKIKIPVPEPIVEAGRNPQGMNNVKKRKISRNDNRIIRRSKSAPIKINHERKKPIYIFKSRSFNEEVIINNNYKKNIYKNKVINNNINIKNKKKQIMINIINKKREERNKVSNNKKSIVIERKKRNHSFFTRVFKKFKKLF